MKIDNKNLVFNENPTVMNATLTQIKSNNLMQLPTLKKLLILVVIFVFTSISSFGQSNSCGAEFGVEKDRNIRSVPPDGTYYKMIITNTGDAKDTYSFSTKNVNSSCSNPDGSSTTKNVNLNISFLDANKEPITEISLEEGQSINFLAYVTVPSGTTFQSWSCNQVVAESKTCADYKVNTTLHTLVIDPSKD